MVIGSTMFNHKDIHKMTWKSPDGNIFNQIDHLIIDARHLSNLMDVRSYRGANIDSDHYLVISKIRNRISHVRKKYGAQARKFNKETLKEPEVGARYAELINEHLSTLIHSESVNETWIELKDSITLTADAVLGKVDRAEYNQWFDAECERVTAIKNDAYRKMQQRNNTRRAVEEYRRARREEKRVHKKRKKEYNEHELKELEHLRSINESRAFYRKLNKSRKDFQPRTRLCRDKKDVLLSRDEAILERWLEHFDELLNTNVSDQLEHIEKIGNLEDLEPAEQVPTIAEMEAAIKNLKNNKAPGVDLIQSEMIKNAGTEYFKHLHRLIVKIWLTETIPDEWNLSIICPIHKKGDVTVCTNYRGINLLCIT
jgi:hypothetical protein